MNSGIGITLTNDQVAPSIISKRVLANYNYQLSLSNETKIIAGIGIGVRKMIIDNSKWIGSNGQSICETDPFVDCDIIHVIGVTSNAGITLKHKDLTMGVSLTQISMTDMGAFSEEPHIFISSSYFFKTGNLDIIPSILFKSDFNFSALDLNVRAIYNDRFWIGTTFRADISVSGMAGIIYKGAILGYAYDYFINGTQFFGPTHEVAFSYNLRNQSNSGNTN